MKNKQPYPSYLKALNTYVKVLKTAINKINKTLWSENTDDRLSIDTKAEPKSRKIKLEKSLHTLKTEFNSEIMEYSKHQLVQFVDTLSEELENIIDQASQRLKIELPTNTNPNQGGYYFKINEDDGIHYAYLSTNFFWLLYENLYRDHFKNHALGYNIAKRNPKFTYSIKSIIRDKNKTYRVVKIKLSQTYTGEHLNLYKNKDYRLGWK